MDSNESHHGEPCRPLVGLGKDPRIPMDTNESHQGSRASLWSEAFNLVLGPPTPGGFPQIGKGFQNSDGSQRISPGEPCRPLVESFSSWAPPVEASQRL